MEIHNNNRTVEKELATAYYKKDRQKNTIMSIAIGMSVLLLYAAFAIADGKVRSDYLTDIRGMGTTANVSLQNGSKKQYEQMQKLSYLDAVGIEKDEISDSCKKASDTYIFGTFIEMSIDRKSVV